MSFRHDDPVAGEIMVKAMRMKKKPPAIVLLGCLLSALVVLSPAVSAAEDTGAHSADARERGGDNGFWTIPPFSRLWGRPAMTHHWTIPSISQRWGVPQGSGRWTIPRTADDMK